MKGSRYYAWVIGLWCQGQCSTMEPIHSGFIASKRKQTMLSTIYQTNTPNSASAARTFSPSYPRKQGLPARAIQQEK